MPALSFVENPDILATVAHRKAGRIVRCSQDRTIHIWRTSLWLFRATIVAAWQQGGHSLINRLPRELLGEIEREL